MKDSLKIHIQDYYTFIVFLMLSTEMLFSMSFETLFGLPVAVVNRTFAYVELLLIVIQLVFFQKYTRNELVTIVFVMLPFVISAISSGSNRMLCAALFIIAGKNVDMDRIIRMMYRLSIIMITLAILLSVIGLTEDVIMHREIGTIRHSLGFNHPNYLGQRMFVLLACHFYLRFDCLKVWDYLLALAIGYFCYAVPNSQTAVVMSILLVVNVVLYKLFSMLGKGKTFLKAMIVGAFGCNVFSIILSSIDLSHFPILQLFNAALSFRFSACNEMLHMYGIPVFGQYVFSNPSAEAVQHGIIITKMMFLDNAYCAMLITYGIIAYVLFSIMYIRNMVIQYRKEKNNLLFILFLIAIYGVMERTLFVMTLNVFLLSASEIIYGLANRKKDTKRIQRSYG